MTRLAITLWLVYAAHGRFVHGVVRRATSDEPIPGALIEILGTDRRTFSDALGGYRLDTLPCDPCRLRVSAARYDTVVVEVSVQPETDIRLDIALAEHATPLAPVAVIADPTPRTPGSAPRYDRDAIETAMPGGDPDPLRALLQSADIGTPPDLATALHVRGGASSDNLVLFDGLPIYGPYHGGGTLSAIAPEVVGAAVLDDNLPSVRYGGGLASTIELESRQPPPSSLSIEGGLSPTAVRQSIMGLGSVVVVARESARPLLYRTDDGSAREFADATGVLTVRLPVGALELVGFGSRDRVRFDANVHDELGAMSASQAENAFRWSATTAGMVWRADIGPGLGFDVRAWYADAVSTLAWTPLRITSGLHGIGVSAEAMWNGWLTGVSAERLATSYITPSLDLVAAPVVGAAYAERHWTFGPRWSVVTGLREELVSSGGSALDPRLGVRYAISPALAVSGGFSRTDQVAQSLRNEESIIDVALPTSLPVAGDRRVPIARADQWTGTLDATIAPRTSLTIGGYTRSTSDLVTVPAVTAEPFVVDRWAIGAARATGVTVGLSRRTDRLSLTAAYGFEAVGRHADSMTYTPTSASPHSFMASLGVRVAPGTRIGTTWWAADARSTSLVADPFEWKAYAPIAGGTDLAGTPARISGPVDSRRLPPYSRVDIGISRDWRYRMGPRDARLVTRLAVTNVFNRTNVAGLVEPPGSAVPQRFVLLPRSLTFGLEWAY
jgi:hypothetical protein